MKIAYKIAAGILITLSTTFASCDYNEDALTPSGTKDGYSVPQGNHDYDNTIVNIYNQTGSYLLYKFTDKDAYWTPSGWANGVPGAYGDGAKDGFLVQPADTNYVSKQVNLIKTLCLNLYSDNFLKQLLPVEILLCSHVQLVQMSFYPVYAPADVPSYYNNKNICFSYGSASVDSIFTSADSSTIRMSFNRSVMQSMVNRGVANPTDAFTNSAKYVNLNSLRTDSACWAQGMFPPSYQISVGRDWNYFLLMMVSYPESYLKGTPPDGYSDYDTSEDSWQGVLNPVKDVNGLMLKRYTIVRNFFIDNYGMDLQTIGNRNTNYYSN